MRVDLGDLGLAEGGSLLIKRALRDSEILVVGTAPELGLHLRAWCRGEGHTLAEVREGWRVIPGLAYRSRSQGAERAGSSGSPSDRAPSTWGLAARGALVEDGVPVFEFPLSSKSDLWSDDAGRIYQRGAAAQWDPATAIPWDAGFDLPPEVEDAVVQVMTYLIENETARCWCPAGSPPKCIRIFGR